MLEAAPIADNSLKSFSTISSIKEKDYLLVLGSNCQAYSALIQTLNQSLNKHAIQSATTSSKHATFYGVKRGKGGALARNPPDPH